MPSSRKLVRPPRLLSESIERKFEHLGDCTLFLCRFDMKEDLWTIVIKRGKFTTFNEFNDERKPVLARWDKLSYDRAIGLAIHYVTGEP